MKSAIYAILSRFSAVALLFVMSFCSKPGSDPNPVQTQPTNPVQQTALISPSNANGVGAALIMPTGTVTMAGNPPSPTTTAQTPKVTATATQITSTTGSTASLSVNYSNLTGAVGGVYAQVQGAYTYFSIPLSGTASASGKITIPVGIPTNLDNGSFTLVISIYDASGRVSNTISIKITIGATTVPTNDDPYKDGDPYAKDYFIEYYENGDFHSLNYTMNPLSFTYTESNLINNTTIGCQATKQSVGYISIPCSQFGCSNNFSLQFLREGWDRVPKVGVYAFAQSSGGNVDLKIDGASNCDLSNKVDTYIKLNITEVKVVKDYGVAKDTYQKVYGENVRGYFSGEFEAILYYTAGVQDYSLGNFKRSVITKGRFKLPMGGGSVQLNGTGTVIKADRLALLTAGKWYFDSSEFPPCLADDYFQFRQNSTYDLKRGAVKCDAGVSENDELANNSWLFKDDQKALYLKFNSKTFDVYEADFSIIELSATTLTLKIIGDSGILSLKRTP